jgi:hypothetical protein
MRGQKLRRLYPSKVPSIGSQRRIQALQAIGYSRSFIAKEIGYTDQGAMTYLMRSKTMLKVTAEKIAEVYDRLSMTIPNAKGANSARSWARKHGYAPPLAWDEGSIDDPAAKPHSKWAKTEGLGQSLVDHAVVERVLAGGAKPRTLTAAESREIVHRALARGHSTFEIAKLYGIKVERHHKQGDAA